MKKRLLAGSLLLLTASYSLQPAAPHASRYASRRVASTSTARHGSRLEAIREDVPLLIPEPLTAPAPAAPYDAGAEYALQLKAYEEFLRSFKIHWASIIITANDLLSARTATRFEELNAAVQVGCSQAEHLSISTFPVFIYLQDQYNAQDPVGQRAFEQQLTLQHELLSKGLQALQKNDKEREQLAQQAPGGARKMYLMSWQKGFQKLIEGSQAGIKRTEQAQASIAQSKIPSPLRLPAPAMSDDGNEDDRAWLDE